MRNWKECQEGNILHVRKGEFEDSDEQITEQDELIWIAFQDAYISEFNEDKKKIIRHYSLRIRLANLKLEYLRDSKRNRILKNDINQLEEQLRKERTEQQDGMTLDECQVIVSKYQGYHVPDTITAYQFFTLIKTINKHGEAN